MVSPGNGKGGARPGSGRKPLAATKLKETIADYAPAALDALKLCMKFMNDEGLEPSIRLSASREIMDRVWGKPQQKTELSGEVGGRIVLVRPDGK